MEISQKQALQKVMPVSEFFVLQWMPVIRTPLGVGKYVLITVIKYTVDMSELEIYGDSRKHAD